MKYPVHLGLGLLCLTLIPGLAYSKDDTLELLAQKGVITADEYAKLKESKKDEATITLKDGLKIQSADGKYSAQLGTLLQLDFSHFDERNYKKDAPDGSEVRRARLALSGKVQNDWDYRLEAEFSGTVGFTDAYASYRGWKPLTLTVGNFKIPYSLESLMSDKNLSFMERSLPSSFLAARAPGFMLGSNGDNWGLNAGLFGEPTTTASTDDEGGGVSTRATWAPLYAEGNILHLGASAHWRKPTESNAANAAKDETWRLRSKPEANGFADFLVDTGNISGNVDELTLGAVELAASHGPLSLQAEYSQAHFSRNTKSSIDLNGWYGQFTWSLTGETRSYRADKGIFEGLKLGQNPAWELAARYSELDLSDADVKGGRERNATLALNSYFGPFVRVSLNAVKVLEVHGGPFKGEEPLAYMLRTQFAY